MRRRVRVAVEGHGQCKGNRGPIVRPEGLVSPELKDPEFSGGSEARFRPGRRRCSSDDETEEVSR
jgi:hypothetical protein